MFKDLYNVWKSQSLIEQSWEESLEMLEIGHEMIQESIKGLRTNENEASISEDIRAKDKIINRYQKEVRKNVLTHLAGTGMNDLTTGLVLTSIVISLERIGDINKNIMDLAVNYPRKLDGGKYEEKLVELEQLVLKDFELGIEAFKSQDEEIAKKIMGSLAEEVKEHADPIVYDIVAGDVEGLDPSQATTIALYVRYLKRINSHIRNVMSAIANSFVRIGRKYKDKS